MARNDNLPVRHQQQGGNWMSPTRSADLWRPDSFFNASPWQMMRQMREDMDRMFGDFSNAGSMQPWQGGRSGQGHSMQMWSPSIDVSEDQKEYCIEVDLPGVRKDDIHVEVQNGQVTIRAEMNQDSGDDQGGSDQLNQQRQQSAAGAQGQQDQQRQYHMRERRYGFFSRSFPLPDDVAEDQIRCDFRDGVLTCHLPKSEQRQSQARRIPVGESSQSSPSQIPAAHSGTAQTGQNNEPQQQTRKKAA